MTLLAAHATEDHAYLLEDSSRYTPTMRQVAVTDVKWRICDSGPVFATAMQGNVGVGMAWQRVAARQIEREDVDRFDQVASLADRILPHVHQQTLHAMAEETGRITDELADQVTCTVVNVGWSHAAGRFVIHLHSTLDGMVRHVHEGLLVTPAPLRPLSRPSAVELLDVRRAFQDIDGYGPFLDGWAQTPRRPAPDDEAGWVQLAIDVRSSRSDRMMLWPIWGDVRLTRLGRDGTVERTTIHTFDDTSDEFLGIILWSDLSLHPLSQARPCWCDSGLPRYACHLAVMDPCSCGRTGLPFRECCSIGAADAAAMPCGCASGAPYIECCQYGPTLPLPTNNTEVPA